MGITFIRPSTKAYDGMNSIEEIMGEYNGYLSVLSERDLKLEFAERRSAWLSSPTILNVRMFERAKEKMLEHGFEIGSFVCENLKEKEM